MSFINHDQIQTEVEVQSERNALTGLTEFKLVVYKQGLVSAAEVTSCSVSLQYMAVNFDQRNSSAWIPDSAGFPHVNAEH